MQPELRQFIGQARFHLASVQRVAEMLPTDDAELDALIGETVQAGDQKAFMHVVIAALSRERRVEAKHLVRGAMMIPYAAWVIAVAGKLQGEVAEHLMVAIKQTQLSRECESAALFTAAIWCEKHRGGKLPEDLIPAARKLMRVVKPGSQDHALLVALAARTKDEGFLALVKQLVSAPTPEKWQAVEKSAMDLGDAFAKGAESPVLQLVADKPSNTLAVGTTLRRAVARVGRNEPCPCGGGKKYKHCCLEKDQERLHHSSAVAGVTQEELQAQPEPHLTPALLDKTNPHEIAKFDPVKIPVGLRDAYFLRLCAFNLFDEAANAFEKIGYTDALKNNWESVVFLATRAGRKDALRRLVNVRPNPAEVEENIYTGAALVMAEDDPAKLVTILNECALDALKKNEPDNLKGFAYALMFSRFRALGILVGRSTVPILPQEMAADVFERILETRDQLNLSPDDPFSDIMDKRLAEQTEAVETKDSAKLRQAQRSLAVKVQEVRELKDTLERLQKEIARREKKSAAPAPVVAMAKPAPVDEVALKEMRRKLDELKSALKERHHERNELRRELQKAQASLEEVHQKPAPVAVEENGGRDAEDSLLLPPDAQEVQPIRLIEFPKHFSQTLAPFPRHVARAAMIMIGRLAAGDPAAYVGALRLKATPNIMRQRIGSDYRLLFRLWPERLEVIDLINRKDLDRRIKTLV